MIVILSSIYPIFITLWGRLVVCCNRKCLAKYDFCPLSLTLQFSIVVHLSQHLYFLWSLRLVQSEYLTSGSSPQMTPNHCTACDLTLNCIFLLFQWLRFPPSLYFLDLNNQYGETTLIAMIVNEPQYQNSNSWARCDVENPQNIPVRTVARPHHLI